MAISLYDLSVKSFVQSLGAVDRFLDKGAAYCQEQGRSLGEINAIRLFPNMQPFSFQLVSVAHHSLGAINGVKAGEFSPPPRDTTLDYHGLQAMIREARASLLALDPDEINALEGRDVTFKMGDFQVPYLAEDFLMSFSLPNLYFHATTAYDILRIEGVPLSKGDYLGSVRRKR